LPKGQNTVVRFKAPLSGRTVIHDVIKGDVVFKNSELDDFIIVRSDGSPTYNFVVVVDDITMGINTVIRGDDHVMNTPKQILIYQALGSHLPVFGHVPMVLGNDRSRLSKRHGAMSVLAYRDMGFLPDAFINYLVRLGWSYGDQEFFERGDLIEKFTLDRIGQSPGIFNPEKLLALNAEHIKASSPKVLAGWLMPILKKRNCVVESSAYLEKAVSTLTARSKTLEEMADGALFYLKDNIKYDEQAAHKFLKPDAEAPLNLLTHKFKTLKGFEEKDLETAFKAVMDETGLKLGKIAQPVRVALTGKTASPGIFEIIEVLGKDRVILRLNKAMEFIQQLESVTGAA
jgi:glutamyl-tRNA synthetase